MTTVAWCIRTTETEHICSTMVEFVPLSGIVLHYLALDDSVLKWVFRGGHLSDRLPGNLYRPPRAYILNTDHVYEPEGIG